VVYSHSLVSVQNTWKAMPELFSSSVQVLFSQSDIATDDMDISLLIGSFQTLT
jgi:hypothetical protein